VWLNFERLLLYSTVLCTVLQPPSKIFEIDNGKCLKKYWNLILYDIMGLSHEIKMVF
jgi:hypothetical protein